jgi:aspartyl-tRNA(Asn)/glutamyl-tRNA(Gln) amidotransferase subunit A
VLATINAALRALESLGAVVEEVSLPHTDLAIPAYCLIATAEASSNLARYDGLRYGPRPGPAADSALADFYCRVRSSGFGEEVKRRIILGTFALSAGYYDAYYLKAMKVRTLIRKDFEDAFRKVDLLAAPVSPVAGFRFRECTDDPLTMYLMDILTVPLNLAGMCGMSLPAGFSARGLPIGLQLIAPPFEEGRLVAAGRVFEHAAGLADRHPCEEEIAACRGRRGP